MTLIVGLVGPAGSGKTTVARYLERRYGARSYALAEPLKLIVQRAFRLERDQLWGSQELKEKVDPRYNVSSRWLMQHIGTDGVRSVLGDDFWVRYTLEKIRRDVPALAIVEDVRFISEAAGIRPAWLWKLSHRATTDDNHASETEWKDIAEDHLIPACSLALLPAAIDAACVRFNILPTLHSIEAP